MRDGIELARRDRAVVALVTDHFWPQGDVIALSNGMPDVPRLRLPHPVAGTGAEAMARLADAWRRGSSPSFAARTGPTTRRRGGAT